MAKRTVSTTIKIDGEKEYKQAVSNINAGLKVMNSEMKKVTAEYQDNAKSVEALKAKNDVLERTLASQKEKVETLRKALENAAKEYGESDKRTMNWATALNNAEAEVANLESQIKSNNKAMQDAQKGIGDFLGESKGLGDILGGISGKFGVDIPEGVKGSLNSFASFSASGVIAVTAVVKAVEALIDVEKKLIDLTTQSASEADNILTMSQITGLDTDTIQEMQYASELIDVSFETIKGSMTKMKRNMDSARDGNESLTESFENLGVSITNADGSLRNSEDVFYDCIDALGEIDNATERDALAMSIFGKSAEELNPLIIQGTETLKGYAEEAHNVSAVMTEEELASLGAVDDAYQRLKETQDAVKQQIAVEMAPTVEKFYVAWTKFIEDVGKMFVESGILDILGNILEIVTAIMPLLEAIIDTILPDLGDGFDGVGEVIDRVCLRLATLVDIFKTMANIPASIGRLITTGEFVDTSTTKAYIKYSSGDAEGFTQNENGTYSGNYFANASGNYNFVGGWTKLDEAGTEIVRLPQGSQIYNNQDSRSMMGGDTFNITIDASNVKEFNDIIRIVKSSRQNARMRA